MKKKTEHEMDAMDAHTTRLDVALIPTTPASIYIEGLCTL
jgi:hypothetical protein